MKKFFTLALMMIAMTISANAMSYKAAKSEAQSLSSKMASVLKLTKSQYDDVYKINLDYLTSVDGRNDINNSCWKRRNNDLKHVLTAYQYEKYTKHSTFYHPLTSHNNGKGTAWMNANKKSHTLAHNAKPAKPGSHSSGHFGNRR
jgi:hypothetical protein